MCNCAHTGIFRFGANIIQYIESYLFLPLPKREQIFYCIIAVVSNGYLLLFAVYYYCLIEPESLTHDISIFRRDQDATLSDGEIQAKLKLSKLKLRKKMACKTLSLLPNFLYLQASNDRTLRQVCTG